MLHFFNPAGQYLAPYLGEISIALIACLLVMLGGEINALLRRLLRNQHFVIRTFTFILLNAFGYGFIIVKLSPDLARTLSHLERGTMFVVVIISFVGIGLWAQKNQQI
ncbi:DUF3392 domain-containing protein [Vibrio mangrovi]|uniref:DUF3392 domain-containing protein n=1 Tax=Vibrio mangrovi TaxID=474394 RepID=A0A1Y6ITL3_9VIBR|nr:DUF3392 domain-containing protein [Vibrio mangrovi]MDW6003802.1 DUF3392 domain-containing protein [Vibrio mangrovi]SMR99403.1 hypothetical protein VIM7927_00628 [Vibrio mangrovi]